MDLRFNISLSSGYKSAAQIARVLTEDWLARNMYCPICGEKSIKKAEQNAPVKDYVCEHCKSQYELKSKMENTDNYTTKVNDGVYRTMIDRITSLDNPSFLFMHYDNYEVNNLIIVPKCFFVPEVIEKRTPLAVNARRAGWEGCNILLNKIPHFAKIPIIKNKVILDPKNVCNEYNRIYSLQINNIENRGWLIDVLRCVERLDSTFTLKQIYAFVEELKIKHPMNNNIEAKIRQQLQFLRDKGIVSFSSRGNYKKIGF
ncbi:MAG: restriction endonuclease [Bacteroidales bacterium]|nr:restriction endonuclease [Bacteroidales bacterium]